MTEQEIQTILTEIKGVKELMSEMTGIPAAIQFMNDKFEETMKELTETKQHLIAARKEKEILHQTIDNMQTTITNLETKVTSLANQQLANNLEIAGIPVKTDENCQEIALKVIQKVDPLMLKDQISDAYRIGRATDEDGNANVNRSLLVKFKSVASRNNIYKKKKVLKNVRAAHIGLGTNNDRIFVNENLCFETKSLFREANTFKKDKGWKYIWSNRGIIYIKENDDPNSKVYALTSKKHLEVLKSS